jgi:hypothetical protein
VTDQQPRREVVAHPMTLRARQRALPGLAQRRATTTDRLRDIDEQTELGLVLVRSLVRAQLALALRLAAVFACVLGGLPLLFAVLPAARDARVLGLDLPWLVLGVLVYPLFLAGSWLYVRMAERNERDFVEIVEDA